MKIMDSVDVTETPKLLGDLLALKGYKGDGNLQKVKLFTADPNTIYMKKRLVQSESAPANDGSVGIPVSADGLMRFDTLETGSIYLFTLTGLGTKKLFIYDEG